MPLYRIRKEDFENELNKSALWAITYGDLMSYLMIFFLLLFSISIAKTDRSKLRKYEESLIKIQKTFGGEISKEKLQKLEIQKKEENLETKLKEMQEANLNFELQSNEKRVKLILKEAVLFDSGSAELKVQAKKILKGVIDELKKLPNDIIVEGHTDNIPIRGGIYKSNFELSMARAYSVIKFMQDEGIDPKRLSGIGYGEYKPIADNSTPEGRAKNRRIEISILKVD
jgi:chemotaxis protein MotB